MKTKRFYEPPKVVTMNLYAEGVLCASLESEPDVDMTIGFAGMGSEKDLSGLWD